MRISVIVIMMFFFAAFSYAQPDYLPQLQNRYMIPNGFQSTINIQIDVPGIVAPTKTISVYAESGKKLKIKGDGLVLLPKKGLVEQFSDLLTIPVHWIFIESKGGFDTYKLVSFESKSDWVTADVKLLVSDPRIEKINLTTRENGEFIINHFYEKGNYPIRSEISFITKRFNIPLKFMGKSDFSSLKDSTGKVSGKIILNFTDFVVF